MKDEKETPRKPAKTQPSIEVDETGRYIDGPHPELGEGEEPAPKKEED